MDVLDTMVGDMHNGDFAGKASAEVAADAPLWFFWTLQQLEEHIGAAAIWEKYGTAMKNIQGNRKSVLEKAVKKAFPPEFINRVDEQIFFNPLTKEDIGHIIDIELKGLKKRIKEAGFELVITPAAKRFVADAGFDPSFGARPLERAIRKYIEDPVSEYIISNKIFGTITGTEARKLRISLSKDKETTVVEWR